MVASRLAKNLINWKQLGEPLISSLKEQLIRISELELSKDLREVINKSLT
ncbi:aminopeptidase N C-terminal domain-containing protein [bacterium]|nr:aminopeptidase N C-terminal domain-containing protein [bacterium]